MQTKLSLTPAARKDIISLYKYYGIPLSRLPYSMTLKAIAEHVVSDPQTVFKFLLNCRDGQGNYTLPRVGGGTSDTRIIKADPLTHENVSVLLSNIPDLIAKAEHAVYTDEFQQFAANWTNRSAASWAYDLIRIRKARYRSGGDVKTLIDDFFQARAMDTLRKTGVALVMATGTLAELASKLNTAAFKAEYLNTPAPVEPPADDKAEFPEVAALTTDGYLYVGPRPSPKGSEDLANLTKLHAQELRSDNKYDKINRTHFRVTRDYTDYLRDCFKSPA